MKDRGSAGQVQFSSSWVAKNRWNIDFSNQGRMAFCSCQVMQCRVDNWKRHIEPHLTGLLARGEAAANVAKRITQTTFPIGLEQRLHIYMVRTEYELHESSSQCNQFRYGLSTFTVLPGTATAGLHARLSTPSQRSPGLSRTL